MSIAPRPGSLTPHRPGFHLFHPILAGATLRDRIVACAGALVGVALTGLLSGLFFGPGAHLPLLIASIGASAVLLFAVPASPMAQPWPIIGGNVLSAFTGYVVAQVVADRSVAAALSVALAILVMSLTRTLHPPGGAAALTAVLGGPAVAAWGALFPLVPVAVNACVLVVTGVVFHRFTRHRYPHTPIAPAASIHGTADPPPASRVGFRHEDVDAALAHLHESYDIDRGDLERLLEEVELQALIRSRGELSCEDIMSRDVITIGPDATRERARSLLIEHNIRVLPVVTADGVLLGAIGLREMARDDGPIVAILANPPTARPASSALALLPTLTNGKNHAVLITDHKGLLVGVVSQTDLLAAMAHRPLAET